MNEESRHRSDGLTEREIEFLLLYAQPMLIKEIAYRCGVAEVTVHKALESARKKLGVRSSRTAARLVLEGRDYRKAIGQSAHLGAASDSAKIIPSEEDRNHTGPNVGVEERSGSLSRRWSGVSALLGVGVSLTLGQRAAAIVVLAFLIVVAAGTLVTVGRGVAYSVAAAVRALS
ncbi:MAG TPA: helix-turn-helix domain-containing protein [Allosphingosinicella sp.]